MAIALQTPLAFGFADPVSDAQRAFRAVMEATARPGTVVRLPPPAGAPDGLAPAAAAIVLTLVDQDTPLWLDPGSDTPALRSWIAFHCGCPISARPKDGRFGLLTEPSAGIDFHAFDWGSDLAPDTGATLVLQVQSFTIGSGWRLRGPGIAGTTRLGTVGVPANFVASRRAIVAAYPRGLDLLLVAGDMLAALPRTTVIEE